MSSKTIVAKPARSGYLPWMPLALAGLVVGLSTLAGCGLIIASHSFDPNTRLEAATVSSSDPLGVGKHSELPAGISRAEVIAQYGAPDSTSFERGQRIDVYYLDDRVRHPPRVEEENEHELFIGDALTMFTLEPIFTPLALYERVRIATGHTSNKIYLTYSADDKLKSAIRQPEHRESSESPEQPLAAPPLKSTGKTVYATVLLDSGATPHGPGISPGLAPYLYAITPGEFQDALVTTLRDCGLFKTVTTLGQENIEPDYQLSGEMISLKYQVNGCNDSKEKYNNGSQLVIDYVFTRPASNIKLWQKTLTTCGPDGFEAALQENLTGMVRDLAQVPELNGGASLVHNQRPETGKAEPLSKD